MVQSSRAVVRQDRTRCDRARRIHFGLRSQERTHALHPSLQQIASHREVEICRSFAPYQYTISWYRPLATAPPLLKFLSVWIELSPMVDFRRLPISIRRATKVARSHAVRREQN